MHREVIFADFPADSVSIESRDTRYEGNGLIARQHARPPRTDTVSAFAPMLYWFIATDEGPIAVRWSSLTHGCVPLGDHE